MKPVQDDDMEEEEEMDARPVIHLDGAAAMMMDQSIEVGEMGRYTFDMEKIGERKSKYPDGGFCVSSDWRLSKIEGKKLKKGNEIETSMEKAFAEVNKGKGEKETSAARKNMSMKKGNPNGY